MSAGLILASVIREPWQLYLTLGVLAGGGVNCLAYTVQSLYLTCWFVRRRGLTPGTLERRSGENRMLVAEAGFRYELLAIPARAVGMCTFRLPTLPANLTGTG